ncbi:MAG: fructose 1,6-bisphosphatase [Candidatus Aenigmarchaeota archaeon]|nr:fructose 1,6-bisphosphatase [Candidatus Aenigmarchaeota archaeon]
MITLSVIKADVGGYVGHSHMHPALIETAKSILSSNNILIDSHITSCGDDLELILTHKKGVDNQDIHKLAWNVFEKCTAKAKELKLYGAGQDLLKDTFSGNIKGMGPGVAEIEFEERPSEPILIFMADKTEPGAWNLPVFKMFADPFTTAGLVIDPKIHDGFIFEIHDVIENKKVDFALPKEMYDMLALIGQPSRYVIKSVRRSSDNEIGAVTSTQRLNLMAGRYVGKDDPVMIVRTQSGFPAVGEALEPFTFPHLVAGWMRGSHHGPFMPCAQKQANPTRFDGPPRVICLGFQLNNGKLLGPVDMFDDVSFDHVRHQANKVADYMRRHGPFEPGRLDANNMEYTTLPDVLKKLENRFKPL